jgi:hypothetical protein
LLLKWLCDSITVSNLLVLLETWGYIIWFLAAVVKLFNLI